MIEKYDKMLAYVNTHEEDILNDLRIKANEFLEENFNMTLDIPLIFNGRLKKSLGRFRSYRNGASVDIQLSKVIIVQALLDNTDKHLEGVLHHELVHYALYEQGLPNRDTDRHFIETCNSLNVPLTESFRVQKKIHVYECEQGHLIKSNTRFKDSQYVCGKCEGALKYKEQIVA